MSEREIREHVMKRQYMNTKTGSVGTYSDWWYTDEQGREVNAVDRLEVVEVERDGGQWVEVMNAATGAYELDADLPEGE